MEKAKEDQPPSSSSSSSSLPSSSSSSLPSHEEVCEALFGHHRESVYFFIAKLYAKMVADCPGSDMDEIKKAVHEGNKRKAIRIMNRVFNEHTSSGDLHRLNAEIYGQVAAHCLRGDYTLDEHLLSEDMKKGALSAKRSVQLSPDNIENHFVLVSLLNLLAGDAEQRKLVVQKCKEALEIYDSFEKDDPQGPTSTRTKILDIMRTREAERQQSIDSVWIPMIFQHYIMLTLQTLEDYLDFLQDDLAGNFFTEAIEFGKSHLSWKFRMCCWCDNKFDSSGLLFKHFADAHLTPQAKSIICAGNFLHGNPSSTSESERPLVKERVSVNFDAGCLFVDPSCLLNIGADTSLTAFPSRDLSITALSYRSKLHQWKDLIDSTKRQGSELHLALEKMSEFGCEDTQPLNVITSGISNLTATEDTQGTAQETDAIEKALERLSEDIESEIKKNGEWILRTGEGREDLPITNNPFGEFDYRDVMLPCVQSCIWAWVELQADKEASERSERISPMANS